MKATAPQQRIAREPLSMQKMSSFAPLLLLATLTGGAFAQTDVKVTYGPIIRSPSDTAAVISWSTIASKLILLLSLSFYKPCECEMLYWLQRRYS